MALLRVGIALTLLLDLALRARSLRAHYTDFGVLPRATTLADGSPAVFFLPSLHSLSGDWPLQAVLFTVAGGCAVFLALGRFTRTATMASWLLLVSLHHRNPMVTHGDDTLLACVLFFGMLLPWGARYSLDARSVPARQTERSGTAPTRFLSFATAGYAVQVALVYLFSALLKTGPEWWSEGSAVAYALSSGNAYAWVAVAQDFPGLLALLSRGVMALEFAAPLLLFSPIWTAPLRMVGIVGIVAFHLGIASTLALGIFPVVGIVTTLGLIPSVCWTWLGVDRGATEAPTQLEDSFPGRLRNGVALGALALIVGWNLTTLPRAPFAFSPGIVKLGAWLRLGQSWSMFAPGPSRESGWHVVAGRLDDGSTVDVLRGGERVDWARPPRIATVYPSFRWYEYLARTTGPEAGTHQELYAAYLCRAWNETQPETRHLRTLELVYLWSDIRPGAPLDRPERRTLRIHRCRPALPVNAGV
ncbi:MAG: HTTM domain-containing protein [Myxococcota bacterium]